MVIRTACRGNPALAYVLELATKSKKLWKTISENASSSLKYQCGKCP